MIELFNIGISEETIKTMIEVNPEINDLTDKEVNEKKELLSSINCSSTQIISILGSNPLFLSRTNEDIVKLINYLNALGFISLNILFDSNPYILNLDPYEIERYINNRIIHGEVLDNIVDDLDSNPYLFQEI